MEITNKAIVPILSKIGQVGKRVRASVKYVGGKIPRPRAIASPTIKKHSHIGEDR